MARVRKSKSDGVKNTAQQLQTYVDACVEAFGFSGSVLVSMDGRKIFDASSGFANAEQDVANSNTTKYRLASITKPFTAVAIFILSENGKLKITDPISKYFNWCPSSWKKITIGHLLTHTSGIPSYTDFPDHDQVAKNFFSPKQLVNLFKNKKLDFKPGEKFYYCNSGYVLLGHLIETISGKSFEEFLRDKIFEPLMMNDTGLDTNKKILKNRAQGYQLTPDNELVNASFIDMSVPYAAGGMYSTVEDLMRFGEALAAGRIISKDSMKKMFKPEKGDYANGWVVRDFPIGKTVGHAGGIDGFATNLEIAMDGKFVSVILSNKEGAPVNEMADTIRAIISGEPYTIPTIYKEIDFKAKDLADFEGTFKLKDDLVIEVFTEADQLMAQAKGQSKLRLVPYAKDAFFFNQLYAQITFERDPQNKVSKLVLHQNGKATEGIKKSKKAKR